MDGPLLNDRNDFPDDQLLERHLGRAKTAWDAFAARITDEVEGASLEWRYYNDGKAWLCKVTRKKTICWVSVWDRYFKVTFYFTARSDSDVEALPIAGDLKQTYRSSRSFGKLKPLTIDVRTKSLLNDVFTLIAYKTSLK